jgi:hypothetical protein
MFARALLEEVQQTMFLSVAVLRCNGTGEPPREPGRLPGLRFVSGHFLWLAFEHRQSQTAAHGCEMG